MLVPTIILCLVSSAFACETYTNAAAYFKSSNTNLKNALSWEKPTESQANYAAVLLTAVDISFAISDDGLSYDEAYAKYPDFIAAALENPGPASARDQLNAVIARAEKDSLSIRNLVEKTCGSDVSADCDCKVEEAIKEDPKLQAQAALIVQFATSNWASFHDAWQSAADNNAVTEYFADKKNKDEFKNRTQAEAFKQMGQIEAKGYSG